MNKTYEIEYHTDHFSPVQREVVTVDGRSARQNRLPACLIDYAKQQAVTLGAYRYRVHDYKPRHISGSGSTLAQARLAYEEELNENPNR